MADRLIVENSGAGPKPDVAQKTATADIEKKQAAELERLRQIVQKRHHVHLKDQTIEALLVRREARLIHEASLKESKEGHEAANAKETLGSKIQDPKTQAGKKIATAEARGADGLTPEQRAVVRSDVQAGPTLPPSEAPATTPEQANLILERVFTFLGNKDGHPVDKQAYAAALKAKQGEPTTKNPDSQPTAKRALVLTRPGAKAASPQTLTKELSGAQLAKSPVMPTLDKIDVPLTDIPSVVVGTGASPDGLLGNNGWILGTDFDGLNFNWDAFFSLFIMYVQKDSHLWRRLMKEMAKAAGKSARDNINFRKLMKEINRDISNADSRHIAQGSSSSAANDIQTKYFEGLAKSDDPSLKPPNNAHIAHPYSKGLDKHAQASFENAVKDDDENIKKRNQHYGSGIAATRKRAEHKYFYAGETRDREKLEKVRAEHPKLMEEKAKELLSKNSNKKGAIERNLEFDKMLADYHYSDGKIKPDRTKKGSNSDLLGEILEKGTAEYKTEGDPNREAALAAVKRWQVASYHQNGNTVPHYEKRFDKTLKEMLASPKESAQKIDFKSDHSGALDAIRDGSELFRDSLRPLMPSEAGTAAYSAMTFAQRVVGPATAPLQRNSDEAIARATGLFRGSRGEANSQMNRTVQQTQGLVNQLIRLQGMARSR